MLTLKRKAYLRRWLKTPKGRAYQKRRYRYSAKQLKYSRAAHHRRNELLRALKDKPCMDCQGWFDPCQMDFDHRNPAQKKFNIGKQRSFGLQKFFEELAKCDLVCANCHRLRTQRQHFSGN